MSEQTMARPTWLSRDAYPFASHFLPLDQGRLHYVDEGQGEPTLFVHGNPSWSFMYRKQIADLSASGHRAIALDHLGFGLSDKPWDWAYLPRQHGENLGRLVDHLGLDSFNLVVHDWGGPIGLSYAVANPQRVKRLVILNTWMWSIRDDRRTRAFSRVMGGVLGRRLTRHFDFFVRVLMPATFPDRGQFLPVRDYYTKPFRTGKERKGIWTLPRQILESSDWLDGLWEKRANLKGRPVLIVWGIKDPVFRKEALDRWVDFFGPDAELVKRAHGHYLAEEMGHDLSPLLRDFFEGRAAGEGHP